MILALVLAATASMSSALADGPVFPLPAIVVATDEDQPSDFDFGDFDLDGDLDLAVGTYGSRLVILNGDGAGGLNIAQTITTGLMDAIIAVRSCDVDADGRLDLAVGTATGKIRVYYGTPSGFGPFGDAPALGTTEGFSFLVADMNGTPGDDFVAGLFDHAWVLTKGAGPELVVQQTYIDSGVNFSMLEAGDLDEDGDEDFVGAWGFAGAGLDAKVVSNSGGTLVPSAAGVDFPGSVLSLTLADVSGDGHLDLVIGSLDGKVRISTGNGAGSLAPISAVLDAGGQATAIAVGKVGADSLPDILTGGANIGSLGILRGKPGGGFLPVFKTPVAGFPVFLKLADLDGTGGPEVFVSGGNALALSRVPVAADGLPLEPPPAFAGDEPFGLVLGDFDGDEDLDAATANHSGMSVSVLAGDGTGSLSLATTLPLGAGAQPWALATADLDADGDLDLLASVYDLDRVSVRLGNGDLSFTSLPDVTVGDGPRGLLATQLGADGLPDLVVANRDSQSITVHAGDGAGHFGPPVTLAGQQPTSVGIGEVNGDGWPDLVASSSTPAARTFLNDTLGGFSGPTLAPTSGNAAQLVALNDVNNNGLDEVLAADELYDVHVLSAGGELVYPMGLRLSAMVLRDLDGDGRRDLAVADHDGNQIGVRRAAGSSFGPLTLHAGGFGPSALAAGDLTGDGQPELVLASSLSASVSVLKNLAPPFPWSDLGHALDGLHGAPRLTGTGTLAAGQAELLRLDRARGSAPLALFTSLSITPTPFKGGTLLPIPFLLSPIFLTTLPNGTLPLPFTWPPGLPSGLPIFLQEGLADASAVHGVALSNAVRARQP